MTQKYTVTSGTLLSIVRAGVLCGGARLVMPDTVPPGPEKHPDHDERSPRRRLVDVTRGGILRA